MSKREIKNLDLKVKYTKEYLDNGGYKKIYFIELLKGLMNVKVDDEGKVDADTVSPSVNAFMMVLLQQHLEPPFFSENHSSEYISTLQKSLFFDQDNIDTPEQFDKIYEEYKNTKDILFRGQREAKWRLYSKLQRFWISDKLREKYQFADFLKIMVKAGLENYSKNIRELLKEVHDDSENDIAVMGFLQHHGCPTPLLDWTFDFKNGLYFGLDGLQPKQNQTEIEDYFSVYYIEEKHFEGASMRELMLSSLEKISAMQLEAMINAIAGNDEKKKAEMTEKFKGGSVFDKSRFAGSGMITYMTAIERMVTFPITYFSDRDRESGIIFSLNNSQNILNQAGVFTWNAETYKPLEMVGNEQQYSSDKPEEDKGDYRFCQCFNINKKLSDYIRERLEGDGITKDFIYPTVEINTYEIFNSCLNNI
ncbi:MAG: FRG domain-containing protein [Bacteroidota bacterium]